MKRKTIIATLLVLLMSNLLIIRCDFFKDKNTQCFSGKVVDGKGNPIQGAQISIGGQKGRNIETDKMGEFKICSKPNKDQRYVLNVEKLGFGLVSKIYSSTTDDILIAMEQATVVKELNPNDNITITDIAPNTSSPAQPDYSRISSPLDTIPFVYDADGKLIAFGAPPEVERTYQAIDQFRPQRRGATVMVEPDALEDPTADREQRGTFFQASKSSLGPVTGSVSTVDVYSPDGMPGDYTTRMQNGDRGFMVTYGAVDVNFYSNGKPLQLKKGKFATISIPVDTLALLYGEKLPPTIPLLVYDKETGLWQRDGNNVGTLNNSNTAYEAKISHFSVFNMDEEFASGVAVCYKICSFDTRPTGSYPGGARIQITGDIPGHVKDLPFGNTQCGGDGGCGTGGEAFAINNMKPNTPIGVRLFNGNTNQIVSSYVFITGNSGINAINCSSPVNYAGCGGPVNVNWVSIPSYMNANGTMNKPIIAIDKSGSDVKISWVYIEGPPPTYTNPPKDYHIEWSYNDFVTVHGTYSLPTGNTNHHNFHVLLSSLIADGSRQYKFRIRLGPVISAVYSDTTVVCFTPDTEALDPC
ncbi:MAG: carboxypeptidase regulatory-like domain-containing protein [Flammeovirgaceae bacterium]|nr:MAG: carboxypeptidase regulatory-like domain-containing protein [Flammeovirgaceae bacterium]